MDFLWIVLLLELFIAVSGERCGSCRGVLVILLLPVYGAGRRR